MRECEAAVVRSRSPLNATFVPLNGCQPADQADALVAQNSEIEDRGCRNARPVAATAGGGRRRDCRPRWRDRQECPPAPSRRRYRGRDSGAARACGRRLQSYPAAPRRGFPRRVERRLTKRRPPERHLRAVARALDSARETICTIEDASASAIAGRKGVSHGPVATMTARVFQWPALVEMR